MSRPPCLRSSLFDGAYLTNYIIDSTARSTDVIQPLVSSHETLQTTLKQSCVMYEMWINLLLIAGLVIAWKGFNDWKSQGYSFVDGAFYFTEVRRALLAAFCRWQEIRKTPHPNSLLVHEHYHIQLPFNHSITSLAAGDILAGALFPLPENNPHSERSSFEAKKCPSYSLHDSLNVVFNIPSYLQVRNSPHKCDFRRGLLGKRFVHEEQCRRHR